MPTVDLWGGDMAAYRAECERIRMKGSNMAVWKKGPPPSVGWWPASMYKDERMLRWWNGKNWSRAVSNISSKYEAGRAAQTKTIYPGQIYWKARPSNWPKRSLT